jgi:NADH-quinone oxidoreductase subunit M
MLTATWLVPAVGGIGVCLLRGPAARWAAALVALVTLAITALVVAVFDVSQQGYQLSETAAWIPQYGISYRLGIDGLSLWLLVLNAFLTLIAVLATPRTIPRLGIFCGLLLLLEAAMAGVFLAVDLVLFYVFWEAMLIPAYFLLWLWGEGERAGSAALKFLLYTLVGSLLMLVGVIGVYAFGGGSSFSLPDLAQHRPPEAVQFGLFFLLAAGFAVKIPVFPLHSWLPDAYLAAPAPLLVTFAGVMGKTGAYGLLRVVIPLLPHPVLWWDWNWVLPVLAVAGIAWGALLAIAQTDIKALIGYSSISHMGFIVLGIFSLNLQGQQGAVLQMVNHAIIITALFLLAAWLAARTGTRDWTAVSGLARRMPVMAGVFAVVTLAALGLPGLNSFVGEFMTLLGAWQLAPGLAVAGCIGLILAPVYMLRLYQGLMQGEPAGPGATAADLRAGEVLLLAPLVALMFVLGLFPSLLTGAMNVLGTPLPWH